jgi:two-component system chemotaxis response regulator CheB
MINEDPELEVIDTARDGEEGVEKVMRLKPDLVTMDVEMPRMNGLQALQAIMQQAPVPILMVSSLTTDGAQITIEALEKGAVDFVCKDLGARVLNVLEVKVTLQNKIKEILHRAPKSRTSPASSSPAAAAPVLPQRKSFEYTSNVAVVALGTSAGGPKSLTEVVPFLPETMPVGVVIVQHMPALFTKAFAERLDALSALTVKEAEEGELVEKGKVIIARGGIHLQLVRNAGIEVRTHLTPHPMDAIFRPSVDVMMISAAQSYGSRVLGVIMTGMGSDGTEGLRAIRKAGGKTLVQDQESSIVYGMPRSAAEAGLADKIVPLSWMANEIVNMV